VVIGSAMTGRQSASFRLLNNVNRDNDDRDNRNHTIKNPMTNN
jgi:hypothetical protein